MSLLQCKGIMRLQARPVIDGIPSWQQTAGSLVSACRQRDVLDCRYDMVASCQLLFEF